MRNFLIVSLLLNVALIVGGAYMFMTGSVAPSEDERTAIVLEKNESAFVSKEMRGLLETLQNVMLALEEGDMEEGDMKEVAIEVRKFGMAEARNAPKSIMMKMPMGFKSLSHAMRKGWDTIADEAEAMGDKKKIMGLLTEQLGRCTACHSSYKVR